MEPSESSSVSQEQLLDEVIAAYLQEVESGTNPDRIRWLKNYPEIADQLAEFFDNHDGLGGFIERINDSRPDSSLYEQTTVIPQPVDTHADRETGSQSERFPRDQEHRYIATKLHARGGMGEVWIARDQRVGRKVALKRLMGRSADREGRFFAEARITAFLEHPGIVPLHDVGVDKWGRPYYVMKFVEGKTLRDHIRAYHEEKDPGVRNVRLIQLLKAFSDVCHAIAFAHSHGVLHRDLKPANVMIGSFGETLVLDWGLSKVIGREDAAPDANSADMEMSSVETHDGAILGSPAYISPEAASGDSSALDERTDVYLLGATLYEILTNVPPRQGNTPYELLEDALLREPKPARQIKPDVPKALEAICVKAMAAKKEDRYASAVEVGAEIERYLAGEPVQACVETAWERTCRWCRRHSKQLRYATLAAVTVAAILFGLSAANEATRLKREKQIRAQIEEFNTRADRARYLAASIDAEGTATPYYSPAEGAKEGLAAVAIADKWAPGLDQVPPSERPEVTRRLSELLLVLLQTNLHHQILEPEQAKQLLEKLQQLQGDTPAFVHLRDRYQGKPARDVAKLDESSWTATDHFLAGEELRFSHRPPHNQLLASEQADRQRAALREAISHYQKALDLQPDHYWSLLQLGRCYLALDRLDEAIVVLRTCISLRPEAPWGYLASGAANAQRRDYGTALAELDRLEEKVPDFQPARLLRGVVLLRSGNLDQAAKIFEELAAAPEPSPAASFYLGEIELQRQQLDRARPFFQQTAKAWPVPNPAWHRLAHISLLQGNFDQALAELDQALDADLSSQVERVLAKSAFIEDVLVRLPGSSPVRVDLAAHQIGLLNQALQAGELSPDLLRAIGSAFERLGQIPAAIEAYTRGLDLAPAHEKLRLQRAWAYVGVNQLAEALEDFQSVLRDNPRSAEASTGAGYIHACLNAETNASDAAIHAMLQGGEHHYLVLHNVACIYARLSQAKPTEEKRYLDLAVVTLSRALEQWEKEGAGAPDLRELARHEPAFPPAMRARADFQELIKE